FLDTRAHRRRRRSQPAIALALCLAAFAWAPASAQVRDNPGYDRPGIGFSPSVLRAGDATLELGLPDWSRDDGVSLYNADALLRFGIGRSLELQERKSVVQGKGDRPRGWRARPTRRNTASGRCPKTHVVHDTAL